MADSQTSQEMTAGGKQEIDVSRGEPTFEGRYFTFAADIMEDENAVIVVADMSGVNPDGLEIDLRDNVLTIRGTVKEVPEQWRLVHGEYEVGGYLRRFNVGPAIDQEKIAASLKDGVLTLNLAKADRLRPRKIAVRAE